MSRHTPRPTRGPRPQAVLATLLAATLAGAVLTGCSQRLTDFTFLSTKNIGLDNLAGLDRAGEVRGHDNRVIIIIIPTGVPNMKEAIDRAIESVPGAVALADGRVKYGWFYIPYLFGNTWYTATGTALVDPNYFSALPADRTHTLVQMDADGTLRTWHVDAATYAEAAAARGDRAINRLLARLPAPAPATATATPATPSRAVP